jgi:hypothetical protein
VTAFAIRLALRLTAARLPGLPMIHGAIHALRQASDLDALRVPGVIVETDAGLQRDDPLHACRARGRARRQEQPRDPVGVRSRDREGALA